MEREVPLRSNRNWAGATVAACIAMMLILIEGRGVWLDEAASFLFSMHKEILPQAWISDVHPPLFSAYAWLLQPLFGGSVPEMRLINLGALLYSALVWRRAWRAGLDRDFLLLFAVLTISTPFAMLYAAEFRSYFLLLTLGACLIVELRMVDENRAGWRWLALTAVLLVNLHYFGCLVGLALLAAQAIRFSRTYRPKAARALLVILAISIVPLAVAMVAMLAVIDPVAVNEVPAWRGAMAIATVAGAAALNVGALAALVACRTSRPRLGGLDRVLVAALATSMAGYFLLNLVTNNLLPRHMIAAVPITAALLAHGLERIAKAQRWILPLICGNALLLAAGATLYGLSNKRWETNVGRIEAAVRACPATPIHALNAMRLLPREDALHDVPHIDAIFGMTYLLIAAQAGFEVQLAPAEAPDKPEGRCPALLWAEHLYVRPGISDLELVREAGFKGGISIERLQRDDARALLAVRSTDH